ncbi:response regulator [Candidatus Saccharibacteria bacterium]|nr:response regulator [Candidatus Saccharibacteria bacterium]
MAANVQAALVSAGHVVQLVGSGQGAIDAIDDARVSYDAIIMEPQLGLHNGIEFLYELRSYGEWQQVPVVMWTMNRKFQDAIYGRALEQLGVRSVLYKPLASLRRLINSLEELTPA